MLIKKIEIISFGKFKNKTLDFEKGLNIICGENESGKSTIISFIYAMIYGFGENRGKGLSLREKYTPWDGGVCEGKLSLATDNGENITIYRKAGSVKKYDILCVYDTDTAKELSLSPAELVGINSDTFLKTLCLKQLACVTDGGNEEILKKLANIASTADENTNYEKAVRILENYRREISPKRGDGGKLSEVSQRILTIEHKITAQNSLKTELGNAKILLRDKKEDLGESYARFEELSSEESLPSLLKMREKIAERENPKKRKPASLKIAVSFYFLAFLTLVLFAFCMQTKMKFAFVLLAVSFLLGVAGTITIIFGKKSTQKDLSFELLKLEKEREAHQSIVKSLQKEILEKEKGVIQLESRIEFLKESINEEFQTDLDELCKERKMLEKKLNALNLACRALESAAHRMKNNFTPSINKQASKYFETLSGEKYKGLFCGEDFSLKVDADIPRSSQYFSGGCVDQMYLSLRLALTDMLFNDKTIFMLLDQPFLQYDEKRKQNALKLLGNLPENRQILLFENSVERFSSNKNTEILT